MSKLGLKVEVRTFDGIYLKRGVVDGGTKIDTYLYYQQTEKIVTEVRDVDRIRKHSGVHNIVQNVHLRRPIHTLSYTIPGIPPCRQPPPPPQKRKLSDGQF